MAERLAAGLRGLEQAFAHNPWRLLALAAAVCVAWAWGVGELAQAVRASQAPQWSADHPPTPVLQAQRPWSHTLLQVLVLAPWLENAVLGALFLAAYFAARQFRPGVPPGNDRAGACAVALCTLLFALAHAPFKPALGAEMLATGWWMSMLMLWGLRAGRLARGWMLSVLLHTLLNALAVGLFAWSR